jgi:hypothetical protein
LKDGIRGIVERGIKLLMENRRKVIENSGIRGYGERN